MNSQSDDQRIIQEMYNSNEDMFNMKYQIISSRSTLSLYRTREVSADQSILALVSLPFEDKDERKVILTRQKNGYRVQKQFSMQCPFIVKPLSILQTAHSVLINEEHFDTTLDQVKPSDLSYWQKLKIVESVGLALFTLHQANIAHRAVEPIAIALTNLKSKPFRVQLNCFSQCYPVPGKKQKISHTILNDSAFSSPDIRNKKPHGLNTDLWSLGSVFYWLMFGKIDELIKKSTIKISFPEKTPKWMAQLISNLVDPTIQSDYLRTFLDVIKTAFVCATKTEETLPKIHESK